MRSFVIILVSHNFKRITLTIMAFLSIRRQCHNIFLFHRVITRSDDQMNTINRFKDDLTRSPSFRIQRIRHRKLEFAQEPGEDNFEFKQSILLANTVPRSRTERKESVRMSTGTLLWKESLRFKYIRFRI